MTRLMLIHLGEHVNLLCGFELFVVNHCKISCHILSGPGVHVEESLKNLDICFEQTLKRCSYA